MINFQHLFSPILTKKQVTEIQWEAAAKEVFQDVSSIHIWKVKWTDIPAEEYQYLLSNWEYSRILKYKNQKDQRKRLISRGIMKELSASYLNTAPKILNYDSNRFGKPFIANQNNHLQFNTSHSTDYIILAIGFDQYQLGIDIEENNLHFDFLDIADQYFSIAEKQSLICEFPSDQFFRIWTRKEAMIKLLGEGINDELIQIDVLEDAIQIANHQDKTCYLKTFKLQDNYQFSLAKLTPIKELRFFDYNI